MSHPAHDLWSQSGHCGQGQFVMGGGELHLVGAVAERVMYAPGLMSDHAECLTLAPAVRDHVLGYGSPPLSIAVAPRIELWAFVNPTSTSSGTASSMS